MKKQILFLTFLIAALLAGVNSYGQLNQEVDYLDAGPTFCPTAVPLTCGAGGALTPAPGIQYSYEISVSSSKSVYWFVTDVPGIVTGQETLTSAIDPGDGSGDYILESYASYGNTSNDSSIIHLIWKSFDGEANTVLLVAYTIDADGCTDNIEVYRIKPEYSFTLDIAGILDDGTDGATECVNPIQTASYASDVLTVDYGTNYVFFAVNAANWQTSWMPTFSATTNGGSTINSVAWAYPDEADDGTAANWRTSAVDEVLASHYTGIVDNGFIGSDGACIIIRVEVEHGTTTENITVDETINLVVNGVMINPDGTSGYDGKYPDLEEGNPDCISDLTTDNADYLITPRPDVNAVDPTPFETKAPTGN